MAPTDNELAIERQAIRERIWVMLEDQGINTNEARIAVDVVMDLASMFGDEMDSPERELSIAWNEWKTNEAWAVMDQKLNDLGIPQ